MPLTLIVLGVSASFGYTIDLYENSVCDCCCHPAALASFV